MASFFLTFAVFFFPDINLLQTKYSSLVILSLKWLVCHVSFHWPYVYPDGNALCRGCGESYKAVTKCKSSFPIIPCISSFLPFPTTVNLNRQLWAEILGHVRTGQKLLLLGTMPPLPSGVISLSSNPLLSGPEDLYFNMNTLSHGRSFSGR